jgi:hypothetical protein
MLSGQVLAVVIEGQRCIEGFRSLAGATDPTVAAPGTIRGDLGRDWGLAVQQNLVHGSDSEESAAPRDRHLVPSKLAGLTLRLARGQSASEGIFHPSPSRSRSSRERGSTA